MPGQSPYLYRRGDTFFVRVAVPSDLRAIFGIREVIRTLRTQDRRKAAPAALEYASRIKHLFYEARSCMDIAKLTAINREIKEKIRRDEREEALSDELDRLRSQNFRLSENNQLLEDEWRVAEQARLQSEERLRQTQELYRRELRAAGASLEAKIETARLQAANDVLARVVGMGAAVASPVPQGQVAEGRELLSTLAQKPEAQPEVPQATPVLPGSEPDVTLSVVVDQFIAKYPVAKSEMLKKHNTALGLLKTVVGEKPIKNLKQADINGFFELICLLPRRWKVLCERRQVTPMELVRQHFDETIAPKTFHETYIGSIRPFLKAAKRDWQDQGFPLGLTTEGIEYTGEHEEGEFKQRPFKPQELKRLFEGKEMRAFAADSANAHCFWLPVVGLFTGARVNEICQLNPQCDIRNDDPKAPGVWFFEITEKSEADPRIVKSVKTEDARKVPLHQKLIELGFLDYVARVKSDGHKLLFPSWSPSKGRASGEAEKWFRQLLKDTNLRDETPHRNLVGMHAFRHTLLTYGADQKPPLSLFCISGHAQGDLPIPATGAGKGYLNKEMLTSLADNAGLLNQLDYDLNFPRPKPYPAIS